VPLALSRRTRDQPVAEFLATCSSGSGKSTLAAGLVGQGYDFLANDLIALSEPNGTIVPWPLACR
jgi:predicted ATPase